MNLRQYLGRLPRAASFFLALLSLNIHAAPVDLTGRVVDENGAPVQNAYLKIGALVSPVRVFEAETDATGNFNVTLPEPGDYLVAVERQGFYAVKDEKIHVEPGQEISIAISHVKEVFQSVDVNASPSPVDIEQTANQTTLTGTEVNDIMYPNSHSLRDSMKLMPGVLEDPTGALHFNGSSENQVEYVLNGFNITDPVSGRFQSVLAVEGVRSMNYNSGQFSPEYGKGSAGALAIRTESGTDAFHFTATDFIPGLDLQQGVRIGNWYPRFGVSGPIVRGRAWFSDMFFSDYNEQLVTGLPKGADTRGGWAGSNVLHAQVNLNSSNILFADFLVNLDYENRLGLSPLDPVSTTTTLHAHEYFTSFKDQVYLGHGTLLEFGFARNYFSNAQSPQGQAPYVFSPLGRGGNYFINSTETVSRNEGMAQAYFPQFNFFGTHQIQAGVDGDTMPYSGNFSRTSYQVLGLQSQILSDTYFQGSGIFHLQDTEMSYYLRDVWRITSNFHIDAGLRQDWDTAIGANALSPHIAFAWDPFGTSRTRISGGYSITHDAVPLNLLGMPLDQTAYTTEYGPNGVITGPPAPSYFTVPKTGLSLPGATNWTLGAEREITSSIIASVQYNRRRGNDAFAYQNLLDPYGTPSILPLPNGTLPGNYQLTNLRRDDYDSVEFSVRQTFGGQFEWMASYTRSRALTNAVLDYNAAEPLQLAQTMAPMPWDSPNRFLGWAYMPLPFKNWALSVLADARSGYPFSIQQQTGLLSGPYNSFRYPFNLDLNIAIERMFTLRGYRFALRLGMDNITDQANPTAVYNTIGSPQFLQFLGDEGRHGVLRIRFFGRAETQ